MPAPCFGQPAVCQPGGYPALQGRSGTHAPPARRGNFSAGVGEVIAGRFRVEQECGRGNFARVVRCVDLHSNKVVAVKMLQREYAGDARFEADVLKTINRRDPQGRQKVTRMREHFTWDGIPCFVFDLLGASLKSRRQGISPGTGTTRQQVAALAQQIAQALQFLHFECRLVHTDLKPENILLDDASESRSAGLGQAWSICDLGSASFYSEKPDSDLITTRPYRAPEVLVGGPWCFPADMWSLGCILFEAYTGRVLFNAQQDASQLALIERRLQQHTPSWLPGIASSQGRLMFDRSARLRPAVSARGEAHPIADIVRHDPAFLDLLQRLLDYDPASRLRADEVLVHPFVTDAAGGSGGRVLPRLPPNPYTAQRVRTPGAAAAAKGLPRPPAHKLLRDHNASAAASGAAAGSRYGDGRGRSPPPPSSGRSNGSTGSGGTGTCRTSGSTTDRSGATTDRSGVTTDRSTRGGESSSRSNSTLRTLSPSRPPPQAPPPAAAGGRGGAAVRSASTGCVPRNGGGQRAAQKGTARMTPPDPTAAFLQSYEHLSSVLQLDGGLRGAPDAAQQASQRAFASQLRSLSSLRPPSPSSATSPYSNPAMWSPCAPGSAMPPPPAYGSRPLSAAALAFSDRGAQRWQRESDRMFSGRHL